MNRDAGFANWRSGDTVSYRTISGEVVTAKAIVWTRATDHQTFYRVRLLSSGQEMWPSSGWMLGSGRHECRCGQCRCEFRSNDAREAVCPTCVRAVRPDGAVDDTFTALGRPGPRRRRA